MNGKRLSILLPAMVVLTMLASLVTPAPVLAAGEPPPPPGEKSPKTPAVAPNKPAPPASPAAASYSAEAPGGAPDGAANAAAVALSVDAIAQAGAVLIGPSGNPMPLAARDTVNVLLTVGDVYFKGSGGSECSAGLCDYDSIANALASFSTRNGSGTIYARGELIEPGAVDVNGTTLSLSKLTGLAWDGKDNYSPRLTGGLLTIQNMLKGFTVDGFYVSQGIYAHDNAGTLRFQNLFVTNTNPSGDGIFVNNHKGNIDLFNVTIANAASNGAVLYNFAGSGNVTITNSAFDANHNFGVLVHTNGSALLERVEATGNLNADGANLVVIKGATVKDSLFDGNGTATNSSGLAIGGLGTLSLQNVEAGGNTDHGLLLNTANDITLNGGFLSKNFFGMEAHSTGGNLTFNNIQSISNTNGVLAENFNSAAVKAVTVSNSSFNKTSGDGLNIRSKGAITLNHIITESNVGNGIILDNALYDGGSKTYKGSGAVSILNTSGLNQFFGNFGWAVNIKSKGAVTIKGVYASENDSGLLIDSCAVDLDPAHTTHNCLGNGNLAVSAVRVDGSKIGDGLNVLAGGAITLDGSYFTGNNFQVTLKNNTVTAAKPVTVTNSKFAATKDANSAGLVVFSKGNITLNNVLAFDNQGKLTPASPAIDVSGILLDNCIYDNVTTHACTGSGSVSVLSSLGPSKALNNAQGDGLFIYSKGAITVNGFTSMLNAAGAYLNNRLGAGALTITNSSFSSNTGFLSGLIATSAKAITLTGVEASQNSGGEGANLDNIVLGSTTSDPITISKSRFDENYDYGLYAQARGNLTLNNVSASYNNGKLASYGAELVSSKGNITVLDTLGANLFTNNDYYGLFVSAGNGAISISGVTASYTSADAGITLNNSGASTPKPVTVQRILVEKGGSDGLKIQSKGSVTLNAVQANSNTAYGVSIDNCLKSGSACTGSGNVSILSTLGPNSMNDNYRGLDIASSGSVTVNGVNANYNTDLIYGGALIDNSVATPGKPVTVTQSVFDHNQASGLYIFSQGVVTLNNINASYNTGVNGYGIGLVNKGAAGAPGINILSTLGNNQINKNYKTGLRVISDGNIVLSKVIASDNAVIGSGFGADLETSTTGTSSISITCSAFNHNGEYGLGVTMGTGTLSFKSVAAANNAVQDFYLNGKVPVMSWTVCGH